MGGGDERLVEGGVRPLEPELTPPSGTLLPETRRRTDFFAHSLAQALNSLTNLPASLALLPFPPFPSPPLRTPFLPLLYSLPSKSRVRSPGAA